VHPSCLVVTGPNMGGKSTYLRQAALIVVLAQIGSFVPAKAASIGIVDKIFARIGASDNLLEGESTFMVEMREASHILRQASQRSLVMIDEIGRGTATGDGLAIAQAILEYLVQAIGCRTLFATHFHELAELEEVFPRLKNCSVTVVEQGEDVCFTHEIGEGAASKSYGLEVATLAGLPQAVLQRARKLFSVYELIESARGSESRVQAHEQITLFSKADEYEKLTKDLKNEVSLWKDVRACLDAVDPNNVTPMQALQILVDLKKQIRN
ncbi:MAG: DNA mismatch repair protein MutS, partial [Bdellovibrionales bacterium]|nr:DNA mismatch repair protein MutS [Bdellovibrionales bacterium]